MGSWMDLVNGLFETAGAACVLLNVRALLRDRRIAGVHWAPTIFFTSWGIWNVIYYPSLGQWWSTAGGTLLVLANLWWLGLVWHFKRRRWRPSPMDEGVAGVRSTDHGLEIFWTCPVCHQTETADATPGDRGGYHYSSITHSCNGR